MQRELGSLRSVPVFEDVQADSSQAINVGVEALGEEANLGRRHRIVFRKIQLQLECSTCKPTLGMRVGPRGRLWQGVSGIGILSPAYGLSGGPWIETSK